MGGASSRAERKKGSFWEEKGRYEGAIFKGVTLYENFNLLYIIL